MNNIEQLYNQVYGFIDKYGFKGFLPGGAESPLGEARRAAQEKNKANQIPPIPKLPAPEFPETPNTPNTPNLPGGVDQPTAGGATAPVQNNLGDLLSAIERISGIQFGLSEKITDPEYINALRDADLARRKEEAATLAQYQMGQMKEQTKRDTIKAWQAITQTQLQRDALMAMSLANTAYLANTPNANVLSALNAPLQQAAQAFQAGKPVI